MSLEPYLVPPPPPPPLTSKQCVPPKNVSDTTVTMKGISHGHILSTANDQAKRAYQWIIRDKLLTEDEAEDFVFISNYKPVRPIIQNGPLCGMVALAMAAELIGGKDVSTEDIYNEAKICGLSLQGEMFSALFMQQLASKFLDTGVKLVTLSLNGELSYVEASRVIIKALLQDNLVLLPYDADKNHGPCLARGHKAHWALVTGFFAAIPKEKIESYSFDSLRRDEEIKCIYHWDASEKFDDEEFVNVISQSTEFRIYTHQGKSKYCGSWNLKEMLESNNNLLEVGPDRDPNEYLLPEGGVLEGLRSKAVFICPRKS